MECFFRQTSLREGEKEGERRGGTERERERERGDEGCVYDITEKVFHMRSAYEHSSHQLMPGRQRETSKIPRT